MRKCAHVVIWGAHAPSRAALGALAKRIFVARSCPKLFGEGAEKGTRGACAPRNYGRTLYVFVSIFCVMVLGCLPDMANQPKAKPLSESDFFSDQANARPVPPHTIERGGARENTAFYTGLTDGTYITQLPVKLTPELLARGRERFDVMCAECHDRTGSGSGMVVQRGFPQPASYHVPRLRNAPIAHFFDVITNGYGVMYSYATRVDPEDRWAIAAYIRALQLSHNMKASELTPAEQQKLGNEQ